jgi:hypothetical protein
MTEMDAEMLSLLDYMMFKLGCDYLSDLKFLSPQRRAVLTWELGKIKPEMTSLADWNRSVTYLTGKKANYQDRAAAKEGLMLWLTCPPQEETEDLALNDEGLFPAAASK